jgi:hypothetical protein
MEPSVANLVTLEYVDNSTRRTKNSGFYKFKMTNPVSFCRCPSITVCNNRNKLQRSRLWRGKNTSELLNHHKTPDWDARPHRS